jgi:hypothetical protein
MKSLNFKASFLLRGFVIHGSIAEPGVEESTENMDCSPKLLR